MKFVIGYYCPRGNGHLELYGSPDYDGSCGSKGWRVILEGAHPGDPDLPEPGRWEDD